jgi:hypothetical protein
MKARGLKGHWGMSVRALAVMLRIVRLACLVAALAATGGCASIGVTLAGVGAGAGMNHYTNNVTSRTFTEPLVDVRQAVHAALKRMAIAVEGTAENGTATTITAKAGTRVIEIELEPITANATRMQSIARREGGFILDSATGAEIIAQTEKMLAQQRRGGGRTSRIGLGRPAATGG